MTDGSVSAGLAFFAGLASFFSPCVLPLVPSFMIYVSGVGLDDMREGRERRSVLLHAGFFVLGFSLFFVLLGVTASALGNLAAEWQGLIRRIGGVIVIIFGLHISGILKISGLYREKRFELKRSSLGYLGSFLVGVAFSCGWTPCVGPILGAILLYSATEEGFGEGIKLLSSYSAGLAIPFLFAAAAMGAFLAWYGRIRKYLGVFSFATGLFLIIFGVLLVTDQISAVAANLSGWLDD